MRSLFRRHLEVGPALVVAWAIFNLLQAPPAPALKLPAKPGPAAVMVRLEGDDCVLERRGDEALAVSFSRPGGLLRSPVRVRVGDREFSLEAVKELVLVRCLNP